MVKFYLKSAIRYIRSNKICSSLNIIGLSVSFAIFILLGCYVGNELNIGKNIPESEDVYRVQTKSGSNISHKMYQLLADIPGITAFTHLMESWSMKECFVHNNQSYNSGKILYASNDFFRVFPYKALFGNLENALNSPYGIVLTNSQSLKIFGVKDAVGKNLTFRSTNFGDIDYQVSAIIEDLPENDMMQFSCIMSHQSLKDFNIDSKEWGETNYEAYVRLNKKAQKTIIESSLNKLFTQNAPEWLVKDSKELDLKSFRSLYFDNNFEEYILEHNNKSSIWSMVILAVVILLAGAINFINLSTAQKAKKRKTITICQTNGASKSMIFSQFLTETIFLGIISIILAIILVALLSPIFNNISGLDFSFLFILQFIFLKGYWTIPIILSAISGVVIALYFQSGNYHTLLKENKKSKEHFRKGLLVVQFVVSIALIISTFVIQKQNQYLHNRPIGFKKDGIVCIPLIGELAEHTSTLGNEFKKIPGVSSISYASDILGLPEGGQNGMSISNNGEEKRVQYNIIQVDSNFFDLMGLKIISGRGFTNSSIKEKDHIFNQTALNKFEISDINMARVSSYSNARGNIVGVVQDFNFQSLHSSISPMAFVCKKPESLGYAYLKLSETSSRNINSVLKNAENVWKQFVPNWPFEYYFLDQSLAKLYEKDQSFAKISLILTLIAILIACLGLFGITIFFVDSKIKEIGIRKVNGAKISEVMVMLNKEFVIWTVVAFFIAAPIGWYTMNKWLENYAYRTNFSWWIFVLAGLIAIGITFLTVSWQSWKAAIRNPVDALRFE